ncbi:MAG: cytosine/adenosine deaminase-related metal-dependent hydrolase [Halobacteriales archaeon]|jgi:cytosine/adenosine deaminase-related metal-dependent hydrolase
MEVTGTILVGEGFDPVEGRVVVEEDEIVAIEEAPVAGDDIVLPAFVNAHTHLGDSIAKDAGADRSLAELVAPPDGLKHRLLQKAGHEELISAIRHSLFYMEATGTGACIEFREGGVDGVRAFDQAADPVELEPVVMGRETIEAMDRSDGFGASGANDSEFAETRTATRDAGKLFGIHAGEADSSDLDAALDLDPDFLVHVVHPEPRHLDRIDATATPIVVCPRSNADTGVGLPPVEKHVARTTVALGTDNVMLNAPSMFREMAFAAKVYDLDDRTILRMATANAAAIAGLEFGVIEEGRPAKLLVLDGDSHNLSGTRDPVRAIVHRAGANDVKRVVL